MARALKKSKKWFAAHVIVADRRQRKYENHIPVYENVILYHATSAKEALRLAEAQATKEAAMVDSTLRIDDQPARAEFVGVRKVVECWDADPSPTQGSEVTYLDIAVKSPRDLKRLASGKSVDVRRHEVRRRAK